MTNSLIIPKKEYQKLVRKAISLPTQKALFKGKVP